MSQPSVTLELMSEEAPMAGIKTPMLPTPSRQGAKVLVEEPSFNWQAAPRQWALEPQEQEEISHSITQTWTDQAIRCYMSGADCATCDIPKGGYHFTCQMNKVVPVLLSTLGQPELNRVKRIFPQGV